MYLAETFGENRTSEMHTYCKWGYIRLAYTVEISQFNSGCLHAREIANQLSPWSRMLSSSTLMLESGDDSSHDRHPAQEEGEAGV